MEREKLFKILASATTVEDVFGDLGKTKAEQQTALHVKFKTFSRLTHPDSPINRRQRERASESFLLFTKWHEIAVKKIAMAMYGERTPEFTTTINSRTNSYSLTKPLAEGDLGTVYIGQDKDKKPVIVKVVRNPVNNDLLVAEASHINLIKEGPAKDLKVMQHLPTLAESFEVLDGNINKQVNVFEFAPGFITLDEIIKAYPRGVDIRDMAWMFNRTIAAMLGAHQSDVIHGAITPKHILLNIETHNGMLVDWAYSVKAGNSIKAIVPEFRAYYPPEVFVKAGVGAATDIFMAAKCMIKLLGGDISGNAEEMVSNIRHLNLPAELSGLFRYCVLYSPQQRPNDAYELYQDFSKILEKLYGERKFREFKMP